MPEEFENAALFLLFFLPSTVICYKMGLFVYMWMENILKMEFFANDVVIIIVISLAQFSSNTNAKSPAIVVLLNSSGHNVDRKQLMHFQSETSIFTFFQHSVDRA